ncbi:LacI family DNA-binding transcriptional regulator [Actinopolymorpha rutila]|uniref:DNA-binding LacI/PurR family transcriptional regulator n=1 Tax=Actinopolymorpha rutila TaxID=446787 RepID=A0A852ZSI6_9ACTN|nr:LacI family DNA-binding transcriptional regulator [Actinopolymorpha rutila]NYH92369.1 DNA-binding LacI/PurR family transcriptional regulator [Actinopolymorpha rutila]
MTSRQPRPRQRDIAKMAGVSQATVSLVLNGKPGAVGLAAETVSRVHEAARELGYVADPIAMRLAGRQNFLLGVHTFSAAFPVDIENSYYPFLAGVEQQAATRGYDLVLFTGAAPSGDHPARADAVHRLRLADGCILFGRTVPVAEIARLLDDDYPLVYIGRRDELGARLPFVGADYTDASRQVVEHLAGLGHERILYVREPDDALASDDREKGVKLGLANAGLTERAPTVVRSEGSDLTPAWVRRQVETGVTAFVAETTDVSAAARALTRAIAGAGLRYPSDVSLALLGEYVVPPVDEPVFTGFAVPRREMGRAAADLLIDLLIGASVPPVRRQALMDCEFVPGETAGPPPATHAGIQTRTKTKARRGQDA